jgi:hypothetical protein
MVFLHLRLLTSGAGLLLPAIASLVAGVPVDVVVDLPATLSAATNGRHETPARGSRTG